MTNFLTIDVGTMSIRAIIYTPAGKILHGRLSTRYSLRRGTVEQNPGPTSRLGLLTILSSAGSYIVESTSSTWPRSRSPRSARR